jgi:hypothetical protein
MVLQLGGRLGAGLTSSRCKKYVCYEMSQRDADLDRFFGQTSFLRNAYRIVAGKPEAKAH